jgi:hypothetical protein
MGGSIGILEASLKDGPSLLVKVFFVQGLYFFVGLISNVLACHPSWHLHL